MKFLLLQWQKVQVQFFVENVAKISEYWDLSSLQTLVCGYGTLEKWSFFFKREKKYNVVRTQGDACSVGFEFTIHSVLVLHFSPGNSFLIAATQHHLCWRFVCKQVPFSNGNLGATPYFMRSLSRTPNYRNKTLPLVSACQACHAQKFWRRTLLCFFKMYCLSTLGQISSNKEMCALLSKS